MHEPKSPLTLQEKASLIAPALRMIVGRGKPGFVRYHGDEKSLGLAASEERLRKVDGLFSSYATHGDCGAFFCKGSDDLEELYANLQFGLDEFKKKNSFFPTVVAVENIGVFSILSIENGPGKNGRAAGKIAVITGSAQGFGKGLAESLACEGAFVVVADINMPLAKKCAEELCAAFGKNTAIALAVDVSDGTSIKNLMTEAVLAFGGIDVLISNAGVLKAGTLEEMDAQSFERVTKINYSGYFLCVKYASRFMKIQHRFDNSFFSDIIQINSKSGIVGSNKNFAYSGGKFGGIGLTQSFALELVDYNIKVNAICPGNFFEGPLWSDPDNGLFAQYLRANKVPGAKTIEDVKSYYESKVPMRRGCSTHDVAKAVLYVIEQQYETGQAVPVTGGQVMLS